MILLLSHSSYCLPDKYKKLFENLANLFAKEFLYKKMAEDDVQTECKQHDVSILVLAISAKSRLIQKYLNQCRDMRIPYVFVTEKTDIDVFNNVLIPVGFLEEEAEKAQYAAAFIRFAHSKITILQAKDYGSRTRVNVGKITTFLNKFSPDYQIIIAQKADSFSINKEAVERINELSGKLLIISASRDYGLDDILFGPVERHVILKSSVPVMIINPRKDLYTLCD